MNKKIKMKWPKLKKEVTIDLLSEINPDICDLLIEQLPFKSVQSHAVVCGKQMYFPFILNKIPSELRYEMMHKQPIGRVNIELNFQYLSLDYGPNYEEVPAVAIGQVIDTDIETIKEVGLQIWNNLLFSDDYIEVVLEEIERY